MKHFPALRLDWPAPPDDDDVGALLALVDDCRPSAVMPDVAGVRLFFSNEADRDLADVLLSSTRPELARTKESVPDEDWAERSQAALTAVRVGRIEVAPPWVANTPANPGCTRVVIQPSMGFGTGHHATTRLCLRLLQRHLRTGTSVLDVGTGSGVLAIAARALGAARVLAVDNDPDALENAVENIALNATPVEIRLLEAGASLDDYAGRFDLVTANLTGALLGRVAGHLMKTLAAPGIVIASGFQPDERVAVIAAFRAAGGELIDDDEEDNWIGAAFLFPSPGRPE